MAFYECTGLTSITISNNVLSIGSEAFNGCTELVSIYYEGDMMDWDSIEIESYNTELINATRYYYSEENPTEEGNFWHYIDGIVTVWVKNIVCALPM